MGLRTALAFLVVAAVADAAETVRICTRTANLVPAHILAHAEFVASQILAEAGIALEWHNFRDSRCKDEEAKAPILMEFVEEDRDIPPAALAYTHPYGDPRVAVFFQRIQSRTADEDLTGALLAHVLAHELAHILQNLSRHSSAGVMKEHWSRTDLIQMRHERLRLAPEDIYLIRWARRLKRSTTSP